MTRRVWCLGMVVASSYAKAATPTCPEDINQFACLYRTWVDLVWKNNAGSPNILDATEVATWRSTCTAWRELKKKIDKMYGL